MLLEDRVITTDALLDANGPGGDGTLQLGPALLDELVPLALHVLVLAGPTPSDDSLLSCELQLNVTGKSDPRRVSVVVSIERYQELPTAFAAISAASALVPGLVEHVQGVADATRPVQTPPTDANGGYL